MVGGLALEPGDEILTSDEEHPGLLGALAAARETARRRACARCRSARDRRGGRAADAPRRLLARRLDERLARAGRARATLDVPVVLDGAQGVGAVPVDVAALGCDAYAGAGQKWLCGPDGTGMLFTSARAARAPGGRRGAATGTSPNPGDGLDARLHPDAPAPGRASPERRDAGLRAGAAFDLLESAGWRGRARARRASSRSASRELLAERGRDRRPARCDDARRPSQRRPRRRARPPRAGGGRAARHPRAAVAAGLGRRLERRERPGAAARTRSTRERRYTGRSSRRARAEGRRAASATAPATARDCSLARAAAGGRRCRPVLNTHRLAQNGYANIFYSAAVKSMLHSLHNFLFVSFDPGGLSQRRQAAAGAVAAGGEREAVRLRPAQPAAAGGDHRRGDGRRRSTSCCERASWARRGGRRGAALALRSSPRSSPSPATTASTRCCSC